MSQTSQKELSMRKLCSIIPTNNVIDSYNAAITENPDNVTTASDSGIGIKATGDFTKFWRPGRTLKISFVKPVSTETKHIFLEVFQEWEQYANLHFQLSESDDTEIRIETSADKDASAVGTDALLAEDNETTMWISRHVDDEDFRTVLLHEIGHILGFGHEHLHREANIPWNKPKVYKEYFDNYGWDKARVDRELLDPVTGNVVDTEYDKNSIMHYAIEKEFTDGVFEVDENTELSENDKKAARTCYPQDPDDVPWK
jgi:hypothetical protein